MNKIAGLRFRKADPIRYAEAGELELRLNNYVVVRTEKGQEFGWVVREPKALVYQQPDDEPMVTVVRRRWDRVGRSILRLRAI